MQPLIQLTGVAVPLLRDNIDTDAIIPSREIRSVGKTGLAQGLFAVWRYQGGEGRVPDPEFILNEPAYSNAQILLAGENFGCGSSREHAVWALAEYGFRVVLAPSFSSIFYRNCLRNGLLPGRMPSADLRALASWVAQDPQHNLPTVDLRTCTVAGARQTRSFEVSEEARAALLGGLDEIDQTLRLTEMIDAFREVDRIRRPWVYEGRENPQDNQ